MRVNSITQYNNHTRNLKKQSSPVKFHKVEANNQVKVSPVFKASGCAKSAIILGIGSLLAPVTMGISAIAAVVLCVLSDLFGNDDDD